MNRHDDWIEKLAAKARQESPPDWPVRVRMPRVVRPAGPSVLALWASGAGSALAAGIVLGLAVLMTNTTTQTTTSRHEGSTAATAVASSATPSAGVADPTAAMFSALDMELP